MGSDAKKVQLWADEPGGPLVVLGRVRVQFNASSGIHVYGDDVTVTLHPAANDSAKAKDGVDEDEQKLRSICDEIKEKFGVILLTSKQANFPELLENVRRLQTQAESKPKAAATPEIGAIESAGKHKGEIYAGIFPGDNKPIWVSEEPEPMNHYDAVKLKGRAPATGEEGKYIDTIKDKGALKDIFARHSDGSSSAGVFWLAEHNNFDARCQQFSDGSQHGNYGRLDPLPVLSIRR